MVSIPLLAKTEQMAGSAQEGGLIVTHILKGYSNQGRKGMVAGVAPGCDSASVWPMAIHGRAGSRERMLELEGCKSRGISPYVICLQKPSQLRQSNTTSREPSFGTHEPWETFHIQTMTVVSGLDISASVTETHSQHAVSWMPRLP